MAKILKGKPRPHVLIVDTNILWHKDKAPAANPDFDAFWNDHHNLVDLQLMIPDVVQGELLFQQSSSCLKLLEKVTEGVKEISAITASPHRHRIKGQSVVEQVRKKFDRWSKGKDAQILPIPVTAIEWGALCEAAIWRTPPFTSDPKNPDNEKGFRDALILETVLHYVRSDAREVNIAFVSNDFLLRTTAAERLASDQRFSCYESLADFSSYIKLTRERLTNEFIRKIIRRAAAKFYTRGDVESLWHRAGILGQLAADKEKFDAPDASWISTLLNPPHLGVETWKPEGEGRWFVGTPEFQNIAGERTYHWKTKTTFIRRYTKSMVKEGTSILTDERKALFVRFVVLWKANVKDDARFHDVELESIKFESRDFKEPSAEETKSFRLDLNLATPSSAPSGQGQVGTTSAS